MSFIYPRVIAISRPPKQPGEGALGYGGQTQAGETVLHTGIRASIQAKGRQGKNDPVGLPGDGTVAMYTIYVPRNSLALGDIKDRDIVTDDQNVRYQVLSDGWDSMGHAIICQRLEA